MTLLQGKTALITGASSGIGRAAAELFAQEGASIIALGRNEEKLKALTETIIDQGSNAIALAGDVRDAELHSKAAKLATSEFGGLDIAFNNAGSVGETGPLAELSCENWDEVIGCNLTGAFLGARAQIPAMLKSGAGSLIFTSSFVGNSAGLPGMAAYGAAKAGLMGLVRGITADYAAQGIRANALLPGGTATPMAGNEEQRGWAAGLHALKRIAEPQEIARAALFLASDMSSFVAGSALWADGGNAAVKL